MAEVLLSWLVWLFPFSFRIFSLLWFNLLFKNSFYFLFSGRVARQVGFLFPSQRSKLHSLQGKFRVFTHWTPKEIPKFILWWKVFYRQKAGGRLGWVRGPARSPSGPSSALCPVGVSVSREPGRRPQDTLVILYVQGQVYALPGRHSWCLA